VTDSSSGWLSTRETATKLRVSEATVRRWGDQGALPARRVGKRGDRRFRSEHVEGFVVPGRRQPPQPAGGASSVSMGGQQVAAGTHLAALYDTDAGRVRLTVPFLAEGLLAGQRCFLLAQGEELDDHLESLGLYPGLDVDGALASGLLVTGGGPGKTVRVALDFFEKILWSALDSKAAFVRIVGEMASVRAQFASEREMLTFEELVNMTFKRFPCVALCQYDVRKFSGQAVLKALRAHPDVYGSALGLLLK